MTIIPVSPYEIHAVILTCGESPIHLQYPHCLMFIDVLHISNDILKTNSVPPLIKETNLFWSLMSVSDLLRPRLKRSEAETYNVWSKPSLIFKDVISQSNNINWNNGNNQKYT